MTGLLDHPLYQEDCDLVVGLDLPWEKLKDITVLVTGASGMIGSCLVDVLMRANDVLGLSVTVVALARDVARLERRFAGHQGRSDLVIAHSDVSQSIPDSVPSAQWVIHAASNTHPVAYASDPIGTITTNVQGTFNLLEWACTSEPGRFCFVSTVEVYGDNQSGEGAFGETDCGYIDCNTLRAGYPEAKRAGEALCQAFMAQRGIEVVIPRLPRVFGPTVLPTDTKAVSQFIAKAVAGQDIVLKSEGNQYYSFIYVSDAVSGLLTCLLQGEPGGAYNVAHPSGDIHLRDLAGLAAESVGKQVVFDLPSQMEQKGFSKAMTAVMDGSKLAGLGWSPRHDVAAGVERTVHILRDIAR
ncbi:MAG: NAD-dependent epimerase/dehydratase family protein [Propionibacteriaceae bacterium]|jgi:nucleoside-diphosphate-sugar epimerase|nr:NAD-dependent epimerase/dehydratase family protein [Propionibacteriaceae bacterium]